MVKRGWRPRRQILDRVARVVGFLETADRFDGVFPHFLQGSTGRVLPFMAGDDGGDLVETAFLMLGLLGAAACFAEEPALAGRIQALFDAAVEYLRAHGISPRYAHIDDSIGMVRYPEHQRDMVRVGAFLYGVWPSRYDDPITKEPVVATLKARVEAQHAPIAALISTVKIV